MARGEGWDKHRDRGGDVVVSVGRLDMRLENKVALITGAGRGIGRATAGLFAREGAKVVVACRSEDEGSDTVEEIAAGGGTAVFVKTDLSHEPDILNVVETTVVRFGALNVLVNNAAAFCMGTILDATAELFDRIFAVNVKGAGLLMKAALPHLRRSDTGCIVNVASINGVIGVPMQVVYNASKAALIEMTRSTAIDFPDVRVNAVLPGMAKTRAFDECCREMGITPEQGLEAAKKGPIMKRVAEPIEIAYGILYLASEEASYATGSTLVLDGGIVGARSLGG